MIREYRTCPACSRRWNMVAERDCPICKGIPYLTLGPSAVRRYGKEAVSRAVEVALELRATLDMQARNVNIEAARRNQTTMVNRLIRAGLLTPNETLPPAHTPVPDVPNDPDPSVTGRLLASTVSGIPDDPKAIVRLAAPPVAFRPGSVAVDGSRPGFSMGGYICNIALANDPIAPLERVDDRAGSQRTGDLLGQAMFNRP